MRRAGLLFVLLSAATACARPVLYYPTWESAGVTPPPPPAADAAAPSPAPASAPTPGPATDSEGNSATASMSDEEYLLYRHLVVPVAGADMSRVVDSFHAGRGGGRVHRAIDILAPRGTPVLAADDGRILRMSSNKLGGITMYTIDPQGRLVYYYAHMERYNDAMRAGRAIVRGDTLGYVGTTGNAPDNLPHLHFQVMRWRGGGRYWDGEPIDPYEALGGGRGEERGWR